MSGKRPSLADSMQRMKAELPAPAPAAPPAASPASAPVPPPARAPEATARPAGFYAATRAGKKKLTASVEPAVHERLKILAVKRKTTTEALLSEAVADLLQKLDPAGIK